MEAKMRNTKSKGDESSEDTFTGSYPAEFHVAVLDEEREGEPYGCWGYDPDCMQSLRRGTSGLVALLCILVTASTYIQYGSFPSSITSLQRKFHLKSEAIAIVRIFYDIGALVILIPVIAYGQRGSNQAQAIAAGGLIVAAGGFTMTVAQFASDLADVPRNATTTPCKRTDPFNSTPPPEECGMIPAAKKMYPFRFVFMAGEALVGAGAVPAAILGVLFLDENSVHSDSALYTAILSVFGLVGPMFGYIITGATMSVPGDLGKEGAQQATTAAAIHNFYGAWWLGMLVGVFISVVGAVLMFPFPNQISGATEARVQNMREAMALAQRRLSLAQIEDPVTVLEKLQHLFTNWVFIGTVIDQALRSCMTAGFGTFLVSHLRNTFATKPDEAGLYVGGVIVTAGLLGLCYATFVQYMLHLTPSGNLRMCIAASIISLAASGVFIMHCPAPEIYLDDNVLLTEKTRDLATVCNTGCECDGRYSAMCYVPPGKQKREGMNYFGRCYAGCTYYENETEFTCSCLPQLPDVYNGTERFVKGACKGCGKYKGLAFVLGVCWVSFSLFARSNPVKHAQLRSVTPSVRIWALGFSMAFSRIGALAGTLVFARARRDSCQISFKRCDVHQFCSWYNNNAMARSVFFMVTVINTVCLVALIRAFVSFRDWPTWLSWSKKELMEKEILLKNGINPEAEIKDVGGNRKSARRSARKSARKSV